MIPLADLRVALGEPPTEDDALIRRIERAAVAYCERVTGRYFGPETSRTDRMKGYGQRDLWLSETPRGTVTVEQDGVAVDAGAYSVRGRRLRNTGFWGHPRYPVDVDATYTAGYALSGSGLDPDAWDAPDDVREAVRLLTAHWYESGAEAMHGEAVQQIPHGAESILSRLTRMAA